MTYHFVEGPELAVPPIHIPLLIVHLHQHLVHMVGLPTLGLLDHRWDPDVDRAARRQEDGSLCNSNSSPTRHRTTLR